MAKRGSSTKWLVLVAIGLIAGLYFLHGENREHLIAPSSPAAVAVSPVTTQTVEQQVPAAATSEGVAVPVNSSNVLLQEPAEKEKVPAVSANVQAASQETAAPSEEAKSVVVANPVPTDEQIEEQIKIQTAQRQVVEAALADRKKQIEDVHQAIISSGVLNSTEVKETVPPLTEPPADIAEKIKSHQLSAH